MARIETKSEQRKLRTTTCREKPNMWKAKRVYTIFAMKVGSTKSVVGSLVLPLWMKGAQVTNYF